MNRQSTLYKHTDISIQPLPGCLALASISISQTDIWLDTATAANKDPMLLLPSLPASFLRLVGPAAVCMRPQETLLIPGAARRLCFDVAVGYLSSQSLLFFPCLRQPVWQGLFANAGPCLLGRQKGRCLWVASHRERHRCISLVGPLCLAKCGRALPFSAGVGNWI